MFTKNCALKIFEGFSIERWNDLIRPFELVEMDKSAEKAALAYIIGKLEEERGLKIDWDWLIYAILFELLKKIALCDIKSPVQRMIRLQYPAEYAKLNDWVIEQYKYVITDADLYERFKQYIKEDSSKKSEITQRVLRAAHKFSTIREFEMIAGVNEQFRLHEIQKGLQEDITEYADLAGVRSLLDKKNPYDFLLLFERLRFQTRWNQTPRVPRTSVLGHSFFVAVVTLLLSRNTKSFCKNRVYNNFFSALFHDLPEAVTRDIISPVKQATVDLPDIVKKIEDKIVAQELEPLMENCYKNELLYFTGNEFDNRVCIDGKTIKVSFEDLNQKYNKADFLPVDGALVRAADHIAAFLEADSSIQFGITSEHLREGRNGLKEKYSKHAPINGFDIASFFAEFAV